MQSKPSGYWFNRMQEACAMQIEEVGAGPVMITARELLHDESVSSTERMDIARLLIRTIEDYIQKEHLYLEGLGEWGRAIGALVETGADGAALGKEFAPSLNVLIRESLLHTLKTRRYEAEVGADEQSQEFLRSIDTALEHLELAAAALLSRSQYAREHLRQDDILQRASVLLRWDYGFLHKITHLLDQERICILHPSEGWGMEIEISGISDNYQLQGLLAHSVSEIFPEHCEPVSQDVVSCFLGEGECERPGFLLPKWQTLLWTAYEGENQVSLEQVHFIWGAGVPADIMKCPALEDRRVILLESPPYSRSMNICRDFEALKASCQVTQVFDSQTVETMLEALSCYSVEERIEALQMHAQETNHTLG